MSEAVSTQPKRSRRGLILFAVIVLALVALVVVHLLRQKKPARERRAACRDGRHRDARLDASTSERTRHGDPRSPP